MSVLLEFAIFPTDKGDSVSTDVSKVINMIRESGVSYQLTSMGTIIETQSMSEALDIVNKSYKILEENSSRIYSTMSIDIQKNKNNRLKSKIKSIENKIGEINT